MYAHYSIIFYALFLFLSVVIVELIVKDKNKKLSDLFLANIISCLLYLPWALYFLKQQIWPDDYFMKFNFQQEVLNRSWSGAAGLLSLLTNCPTGHFPMLVTIALWTIFFLPAIYFIVKNSDFKRKLVVVFTSLYLLVLFLTPLHNLLADFRYSIYIFPFFYLSIVLLIEQIKPKVRYLAFLIIMVPFLFYFSLTPKLTGGWRELAKFFVEKSQRQKIELIYFEKCYDFDSVNFYSGNFFVKNAIHIDCGNVPEISTYPKGTLFTIETTDSGKTIYKQIANFPHSDFNYIGITVYYNQ